MRRGAAGGAARTFPFGRTDAGGRSGLYERGGLYADGRPDHESVVARGQRWKVFSVASSLLVSCGFLFFCRGGVFARLRLWKCSTCKYEHDARRRVVLSRQTELGLELEVCLSREHGEEDHVLEFYSGSDLFYL